VLGAVRFLSGYPSPLATVADSLSVHRISEASKHVFAIRMSLSDPAYNTDTVNEAVYDMTQGTLMEELRQATRDDTTLPLSQYGGEKWAQLDDTDGQNTNVTDASEGDRRRRRQRRKLYERFGYLNDDGTSHFSIVDKDGNAVAMTTSINTIFGSQVVSKSTGIVFGNTMNDFGNPGAPNFFGLHPSEANFIQPGKKPLSSMSPTMVFRNPSNSVNATEAEEVLGNLTLVVGGSGGPKIISAVLQVLLNNIMLGMPLYESVVHPRIHDQLIYHDAAILTVEKAPVLNGPEINLSKRTRDALSRRNHTLLDVDYMGCVQAVAVDLETGHLSATCDVRKGGKPAGF